MLPDLLAADKVLFTVNSNLLVADKEPVDEEISSAPFAANVAVLAAAVAVVASVTVVATVSVAMAAAAVSCRGHGRGGDGGHRRLWP